jgi:hypothetical protein
MQRRNIERERNWKKIRFEESRSVEKGEAYSEEELITKLMME